MILYKKEKLAFLHINKTGGTSMKGLLNHVLGHKGEIIGTPGEHYLHESLENKFKLYDLSDISIFTLIRNPFARMYSIYLSALRNFNTGVFNNNTRAAGKYNFKDWYKNFTMDMVGKVYWLNTITSYVLVDGQLPSNLTIFRLEDNKDRIRKYLSNQLSRNIFAPFPRLNTFKGSSNPNFMDFYDDEVKLHVYEQDKWIFDNYYKEIL